MDRNHIPGLAVAIVRDGQISKLKAYGMANLEWRNPMTPETAVQLASTSKTFTGIALGLLTKSGELSLDAPVTRYLNGLPHEWSRVKVINLATHTSGVPEGEGTTPSTSTGEAVALAAQKPLIFVPGERDGYASADFTVLGDLISRVSGEPYEAFVTRHIFRPLGMDHTAFDDQTEMGPIRTSEIIPRRASIYRWNGERQSLFSFLYTRHAIAAGGAYSTAQDLARFAVGLDKGKLLEQAELGKLWTPYRLNNGELTQWGVGWVIRTYEGRRTVGHSGGPAYSDILRFPDLRLTIIVLQNQQRMYPYLAQGVADRILTPQPKSSSKAVSEPNDTIQSRCVNFLRGLGKGQLDARVFSASSSELAEDVKNLLVPFAQSQGPINSIRCVRVTSSGPHVELTYEVKHGVKVIVWNLTCDSSNRLIDVQESTP